MKSNQRRSSKHPASNKPLRHYEELRTSDQYRFRPESQIIEVQDENGEEIRLLHVLNIMSTPPISSFIYYEAASLLALKHFNDRSNLVINNLSEQLDGCNVYLTMDMLNAGFDQAKATSKLYSYFAHAPTIGSPHPAGVIGATVSRISEALAVLTGAYQIPQISPGSQLVELDHDDIAPTFSRTVPTAGGIAHTVASYFEKKEVTHFYILYQYDSFGFELRNHFVQAIKGYGITMLSAGYDASPNSLEQALKTIKDSGVRYIFGVMHTTSHRGVLEQAYDAGLIGADYAWFIPDVITQPSLSLNRTSDEKYIASLQGMSQIGFWTRPHPTFEAELRTLQTDPDFQSFYIEAHRDEGGVFRYAVNITEMFPIITFYSYYDYDAVMALGIAACNTRDDDPLFSGATLNQEIRRTIFQGVTGSVELDPHTGTRRWETASYGIENFFVDNEISNHETAHVKTQTAVVFSRAADEPFHELHPLIFADGSSTPPAPLVRLEQDLNLISTGILSIGWILAGGLILTCLVLIVWVNNHRADQKVAAAQPEFLILLLFGTILMASSIIPETFQEPTSQEGLNIACMATPWLFVTGFSIAFGSIFTKTWRLSLIIKDAVAMHRSKQKIWRVMRPFILFVAINIVLLSLWTAISPLRWMRSPSLRNLDSFGRSLESFGSCTGSLEGPNQTVSAMTFPALIFGINLVALLATFFQAYSKRRVPALFNDAPQLALCIACLLESFVIGIPVLVVASSNPTAFFVVKALVIGAVCFAILFPNFGSRLSKEEKKPLGIVQAEWREFFKSREHSSRKLQPTRRFLPKSSDSTRGSTQSGSATGQLPLCSSSPKRRERIRTRHAALLDSIIACEEKHSEKEHEEATAAYASTVTEIRRRASLQFVSSPSPLLPGLPEDV